MTVCATCSRELQPEWKYCISCGTPTGVPLTAAIDIIRAEDLAQYEAEPAEYDDANTGVLRIEDIPADEPAPTPDQRATAKSEGRINVVAVFAFVLGCLVSPLAAVFGHIALSQISRSGERGTAIAWVAIVLGYLSLAALLVLGISYLVLNA
jgi:hypothetical protein